MTIRTFIQDRLDLKWSKAVYRKFVAEPLWSTLLLFVLAGAYFMAQRVDPNAGITKADIIATCVLLLVGVLKVIVITFTASWCKDKYTKDLSDEEEVILLDRASREGKGIWVLVVDRLEWFGWLAFCWAVILHS